MTIAPVSRDHYSLNCASDNGNSFEDCLMLCHFIELTLDIREASYTLARVLVCSFVQPAILPCWISMCVHEHWLIYWCTSNVYNAWLQMRIHFELDWNHLLKWIGSKLVWIRFLPIHFLCERDECTLNPIECPLSMQCERAFIFNHWMFSLSWLWSEYIYLKCLLKLLYFSKFWQEKFLHC